MSETWPRVKLDDIKDHLAEAASAAESMFFSPPGGEEIHQRRLARALNAVAEAGGLKAVLDGKGLFQEMIARGRALNEASKRAELQTRSTLKYEEHRSDPSLLPEKSFLDVLVTLRVRPSSEHVFRKNLRFAALPFVGQTIHFPGWEGVFTVRSVGWFSLDDIVVSPRIELHANMGVGVEYIEQLKKEGWT